MGNYLLERLRELGFAAEKLLIYRSLASDEGTKALWAATDSADLLVLSFPLYVDSLPALVIETLESLAGHRQACGSLRKQRLLAIVQCGFPETHQNDTALAICRRFAKEAGFEWAGGLALGGGVAIDGRPLSEVKGMARNVIKALNLSADALGRGEPVPQEAVRLMAKPLMPTWLYLWVAEWNWRRRAKKHKVLDELDARPYKST